MLVALVAVASPESLGLGSTPVSVGTSRGVSVLEKHQVTVDPFAACKGLFSLPKPSCPFLRLNGMEGPH